MFRSLVLWITYLIDSSWFAQAALTVLLMALLMGGILLLAAGVRNLIRDFWQFLHPHSH
jgi:hypothetical protein